MKHYHKHVRHTHEDLKTQSWCGVPLTPFDWCFMDIDHACYAARNGSRLLPCPECVKAIVETLTKE